MNWKATYDTPHINLERNSLTISGKSIMEDPYSFYQPIIKKIPSIINSIFIVELDIKTINAPSKKQIYRILSVLKENRNIETLKVLWLCDPSDDDGFDLGKELEFLTEIDFEYLDYA